MPIPISQTLQLAGQQEVTPWQLPFEELAAGLEKKQQNFDAKSEAVSLLDSLIPESGVFTVEAKQGLLDDIDSRHQELRCRIKETHLKHNQIIAIPETAEAIKSYHQNVVIPLLGSMFNELVTVQCELALHKALLDAEDK